MDIQKRLVKGEIKPMAQPPVEIKITGLEELDKKLQGMSQEFAAKSIVGAAYTANKEVVDAIRSNLQSDGLVDTGLLNKSITRKKLIYPKDSTVVIMTGVSKSVKGTDKRGRPRVPWRYANILEARYNFTKNAFEGVKQNVIDKFVKSLASRIKRFEKGGK